MASSSGAAPYSFTAASSKRIAAAPARSNSFTALVSAMVSAQIEPPSTISGYRWLRNLADALGDLRGGRQLQSGDRNSYGLRCRKDAPSEPQSCAERANSASVTPGDGAFGSLRAFAVMRAFVDRSLV
jgi:hypothetical protein